jgi:hypothetical protein
MTETNELKRYRMALDEVNEVIESLRDQAKSPSHNRQTCIYGGKLWNYLVVNGWVTESRNGIIATMIREGREAE